MLAWCLPSLSCYFPSPRSRRCVLRRCRQNRTGRQHCGHHNSVAVVPAIEPAAPRSGGLLAEVTLADIGFVNGLRFANLGGHHELFVPLPQDGEVTASDLVLVLDDVSQKNLPLILPKRPSMLTAIPKTAASGAGSALALASESDSHRRDAENAAGG